MPSVQHPYQLLGKYGDDYNVESGSGVLAVVTFECLEIGISSLDLSSRLFDIDLNPMPLKDETMLAIGMISMDLAILIGRFLYHACVL